MNEKLAVLLDIVRQTAVQAGSTASNAAYGVGKGAEALLSTAKLNIRLADRKAEVDTRMQELGELLYATHVGSPTDSDVLLEKLQEIDALKEEIRELNRQAGRAQAARTCPVCGTPARAGDSFCRECGGLL